MTDRSSLVRAIQNETHISPIINILKTIKNDIVGNEARKGEFIRDGLLPALRQLTEKQATTHNSHQSLLYQEIANLVNLLASEGPIYTGPVLESELVVLFLRRLHHQVPPRETLALLKSLCSIASNLPSKDPGQWTEDPRLADLVYDRSVITFLVQAVADASSLHLSQQICEAALCLICLTCKAERQKRILTDRGLLSVLAQRLASFVVAEGLVPPSLETLDFPSSAAFNLPDPAPPHAHLSPVLETISLLVADSQDRIDLFLSDPALITVLPQPRDDRSPTEARPATWSSIILQSSTLNRPRFRNPFDALLPPFQTKERTNTAQHLNFPPLGSGGPSRRRSSHQPASQSAPSLNIIPENQVDSDERTIIPFLAYLARVSRGKRRFLACKLLVILSTNSCISAFRYRSLSGVLLPILTKMLDSPASTAHAGKDPISAQTLCNGNRWRNEVPAVLAELIRDNQELQRVTVETKAIPLLALGLRHSFAHKTVKRARLWRLFKPAEMEMQITSPDCSLGHGGPSSMLRQQMTYREGTLRALAAIAPFDDDYRKQICDQGVLSEIILAMHPFDDQSVENDRVIGNAGPTILAACGAVRALTRSVTALRTKLVDADVAKSVISLMNSTDLEVRIAATQVLSNLAMDFSPMKDSVGESAVVKKLCEQAHSANARLRMESLWALKQLVANAPRKLKQEVVDELGISWIKLLIGTDPYDIPPGEVIGLVERVYPPRSGYAELSDDVVMSEDSDGEESMSYADTTSDQLADSDDDFDRHTPEEDLAIQMQLLDVLRNAFVTSAMSESATELVEYVLQGMGIEDFFRIMKTRLSPKTAYGPTRQDNHIIDAPVGVVIRVMYIILHVAACSQKWRMVIASDQELLKKFTGLASHEDREVRANCCWLAINLMFDDEGSDRPSCKHRAKELSRMGYRLHIQKLENDSDLDVRERAKTAMLLFSSLLDSGRS